MSTAAVWAFVAVALLFVAAVAAVFLACRSVFRKGKRLIGELDALQDDLDRVTANRSDVHLANDAADGSDRYAGYHRRGSSRQEEVDHG